MILGKLAEAEPKTVGYRRLSGDNQQGQKRQGSRPIRRKTRAWTEHSEIS